MDDEQLNELRNKLLERRKELLSFRRTVNTSWRELREPEKEAEEMAGKVNLSRPLEDIDERMQTEIRKIDAAIADIEEGDYGFCKGCGEPIAIKRLHAVPSASFCIECATAREGFDRSGIVAERPATEGKEPLKDEEMVESVYEALNLDGRVETEELDIHCYDGVLTLDGALPSKKKHQILLQIIEDTLNFNEIIDNIKIDRQPWERLEKTANNPDRAKTEKDVMIEGEEEDIDVHESWSTGEPMMPPDAMTPEKDG